MSRKRPYRANGLERYKTQIRKDRKLKLAQLTEAAKALFEDIKNGTIGSEASSGLDGLNPNSLLRRYRYIAKHDEFVRAQLSTTLCAIYAKDFISFFKKGSQSSNRELLRLLKAGSNLEVGHSINKPSGIKRAKPIHRIKRRKSHKPGKESIINDFISAWNNVVTNSINDPLSRNELKSLQHVLSRADAIAKGKIRAEIIPITTPVVSSVIGRER